MFPTSIEGSFPLATLTPATASAALEQFEQQLELVRAADIVRVGNSVSFRGGLWRLVSNWNVLGPVDSGTVEIVDGVVRYEFRTVEMLVVVSLMALVGGIYASVTAGSASPGLTFFAFAMLWLFGANYALSVWRLRRFVAEAFGPAIKAVDGSGPESCPSCGRLYDPADYQPDVEARCERCHSVLPAVSTRA